MSKSKIGRWVCGEKKSGLDVLRNICSWWATWLVWDGGLGLEHQIWSRIGYKSQHVLLDQWSIEHSHSRSRLDGASVLFLLSYKPSTSSWLPPSWAALPTWSLFRWCVAIDKLSGRVCHTRKGTLLPACSEQSATLSPYDSPILEFCSLQNSLSLFACSQCTDASYICHKPQPTH